MGKHGTLARPDHLRVCGADLGLPEAYKRLDGSSPRVRSRRAVGHSQRAAVGIISACAEQTHGDFLPRVAKRDHLRVCGADIECPESRLGWWGSSPRVRSRHGNVIVDTTGDGIISVCAEQTSHCSTSARFRRDHLRVCGADLRLHRASKLDEGSSPRVRSRPFPPLHDRAVVGIISACAEQT